MNLISDIKKFLKDRNALALEREELLQAQSEIKEELLQAQSEIKEEMRKYIVKHSWYMERRADAIKDALAAKKYGDNEQVINLVTQTVKALIKLSKETT